jgi:hypothetical protein
LVEYGSRPPTELVEVRRFGAWRIRGTAQAIIPVDTLDPMSPASGRRVNRQVKSLIRR